MKKPVRVALIVFAAAAPSLGLLSGLFVFRSIYVPSASMQPGYPVGSQLLVDRTAYWTGSPARGDVVVTEVRTGQALPDRPHLLFLRRVIGVGGDTIECCDPSGRVIRNGLPIDEPYVGSAVTTAFSKRTVPRGELFLMGDHRDASSDSRYNGTVPASLVRGQVIRSPVAPALVPWLLGVVAALVIAIIVWMVLSWRARQDSNLRPRA